MNIRNLSMSYGIQELFSNVNIQIDENEKVGVVGLNGAGKSTFFKIIMKFETPDSGKISFKNNARVEWLPQEITYEIPSFLRNSVSFFAQTNRIPRIFCRVRNILRGNRRQDRTAVN